MSSNGLEGAREPGAAVAVLAGAVAGGGVVLAQAVWWVGAGCALWRPGVPRA